MGASDRAPAAAAGAVVYLRRLISDDFGTFGVLRAPGFTALTIECPWRDNASSISCIPGGRYQVKATHSPRFGRQMLLVLDVPGRSGIRFHSGNLAGDRAKGLVTHFEGCIGLGARLGVMSGQRAVLASSPQVRRLEDIAGGFDLIIEGQPWNSPALQV